MGVLAMVDFSRSTVSRVTRESLLQFGKVAIAGTAIEVTATIGGFANDETSAMGYLQDNEKKLETRVTKAVKVTFRDKGKDYTLDPIRFSGNQIYIVVYGQSSERNLYTSYGGERWRQKADRLQFLIRQHIKEVLRDGNFAAAFVNITWEPGDGVLGFDYLGDQGSRDPMLSIELRRLRDEAEKFHGRRNQFFLMAVILAVVISFAAYLLSKFVVSSEADISITSFGLLAFYVLVLLVIGGVTSASRYRHTTQEIYRKEADLDLRNVLGDNDNEQNAYRLFQVNASELKLYYNQALRQRALVFSLGVFCILAGFAVVAVTLFILAFPLHKANPNEKVVVAIVGSVGAILANFVAVIFLQMFRSIVASMVDFHNRLVLTHNIYFGNLLLARVSNDTLRQETLSKLALTLSNMYGSQATKPGVGGVEDHLVNKKSENAAAQRWFFPFRK